MISRSFSYFRYDEEMKDYVDWCRKPGPSVNVPGVMPQGMRLPLMRSTPRPLMMGPGLSRLSAAAPAQPPMVTSFFVSSSLVLCICKFNCKLLVFVVHAGPVTFTTKKTGFI